MAKKIIDNIKLGVFVTAGLFFLVLLLYLIGKNSNLFGDTYVLKAKFENVQGLIAGNNIRYAGIQTGTVKKIDILNDTVIEVAMLIDKKMLSVIRKNAIVSIGTEGFVGNKVVNIVPAHLPGPLAEEGDILFAKKTVSAEDMLQTLSKTNADIAEITGEIKSTVRRISNSTGLWGLLDDKSIPQDLRMAVANIRSATGKAGSLANNLSNIVTDIKNGKGSMGALLTDTSFAKNLNEAIVKIKSVGDQADSVAVEMNKIASGIRQDADHGRGVVNALLKDSGIVTKINASLDNIQKGTDGFNQNMEALKHNILFRGYFRKLEKQKKQAY